MTARGLTTSPIPDGERPFLPPYEAVRTANDRDTTLLAFRQSTHAAAAVNAGWEWAGSERNPLPPR